MKVVSIMATHERVDLTKKSCDRLIEMGCDLVLVVSSENDLKELKNYNPVQYKNNPLGAKWQFALNTAKNLNPDIILICGSDDILDIDYLKNALELVNRGYDFVGVSEWFMHDVLRKRLYKASYKFTKGYPVGSGRVLTKRLLDYLNWKCFDPNAERRLDDCTNTKVVKTPFKVFISDDVERDGLKITAIKGGHNQLNPIHKFFKAPNIEIKCVAYQVQSV